jgi:hypothetical protein
MDPLQHLFANACEEGIHIKLELCMMETFFVLTMPSSSSTQVKSEMSMFHDIFQLFGYVTGMAWSPIPQRTPSVPSAKILCCSAT